MRTVWRIVSHILTLTFGIIIGFISNLSFGEWSHQKVVVEWTGLITADPSEAPFFLTNDSTLLEFSDIHFECSIINLITESNLYIHDIDIGSIRIGEIGPGDVKTYQCNVGDLLPMIAFNPNDTVRHAVVVVSLHYDTKFLGYRIKASVSKNLFRLAHGSGGYAWYEGDPIQGNFGEIPVQLAK